MSLAKGSICDQHSSVFLRFCDQKLLLWRWARLHYSCIKYMFRNASLDYEVFTDQCSSNHLSPIVVAHGLFDSKTNWRNLNKKIHIDTGRKVSLSNFQIKCILCNIKNFIKKILLIRPRKCNSSTLLLHAMVFPTSMVSLTQIITVKRRTVCSFPFLILFINPLSANLQYTRQESADIFFAWHFKG